MIASIKPGILIPENQAENIPGELIYDIIDGNPYCHNSPQGMFPRAIIRSYLLEKLFEGLKNDPTLLVASAPALFLDNRNLVTSDIMVFERDKLTIDENYAQIPPKIVIEIDVKMELGDMQPDVYVFMKANKLVNFGVGKVMWFFMESKKVMVVDNHSWTSEEWDEDINILPGISCNIGHHLRHIYKT